jgi:hypothetical protein
MPQFTRDVLLNMLRREDALRRSDETQSLYDVSGDAVPPFSIEEEIQLKVLNEFGFEPKDLDEYRLTHGRYLGDKGESATKVLLLLNLLI